MEECKNGHVWKELDHNQKECMRCGCISAKMGPARGYTLKQQEHLNHDFYKQAAEHREGVRMDQILKGAAKYPTPFNPFEWTPKQLLEHAIQENVDQGHYEYGLYLWIERLEEDKNSLLALSDRVGKERNELKSQLVKALEEREEAREGCEKLRKAVKEKNTHIIELTERAGELEKERDLWVKVSEKSSKDKVDLIKERDEYREKSVRLQNDIFELEGIMKNRKQPLHDCYKNQAIIWNGHPSKNEIQAIRCRVCNKYLFGGE